MADKVTETNVAGLSPQDKPLTVQQETGDNTATTNPTLPGKQQQTVLVWSHPTWKWLPHPWNQSCWYQYATCPVTASQQQQAVIVQTKRKWLQNVNMSDNDITTRAVLFINIYLMILVSTRLIQNTHSQYHANNTKHKMLFLFLQLCHMQYQRESTINQYLMSNNNIQRLTKILSHILGTDGLSLACHQASKNKSRVFFY